MKYRIYIDEVWKPDMGSSDNPNHRFLSLTGIIIELNHVQSIVHPQLEALKVKYFHPHPDEPVILHRKELVNQKPPFEVLKNSSIRNSFDQDLLNLINSWEYTVVTVCIDKKNHKETYKVWRYDPYHYCLEVLLERYIFFLEVKHGQGDVMAESRGGKEDIRLKSSYAGLWKHGTDYLLPERFHASLTSKQLKVKLKINNIVGLQLADLLAHPSRSEMLHERGLLNRDLPPFGKAVIEILQRKYYQRSGRIFGKKFI